jgi:hypothetical protein
MKMKNNGWMWKREKGMKMKKNNGKL